MRYGKIKEKMNLPKLNIEKKTGTESFTLKNEVLPFNLNDFWSWNQSDLVENRTRGILAEFIVLKALNIKSKIRQEWDKYDLLTDNGLKIEIKSASYLQTWEQDKFSTIQFDIKPTFDNEYELSEKKRWADFYVFCLLNHKNQQTINPMDLEQWTFYVLSAKILDKEIPNQKTITLSSLLSLKPVQCSYFELKNIIK